MPSKWWIRLSPELPRANSFLPRHSSLHRPQKPPSEQEFHLSFSFFLDPLTEKEFPTMAKTKREISSPLRELGKWRTLSPSTLPLTHVSAREQSYLGIQSTRPSLPYLGWQHPRQNQQEKMPHLPAFLNSHPRELSHRLRWLKSFCLTTEYSQTNLHGCRRPAIDQQFQSSSKRCFLKLLIGRKTNWGHFSIYNNVGRWGATESKDWAKPQDLNRWCQQTKYMHTFVGENWVKIQACTCEP